MVIFISAHDKGQAGNIEAILALDSTTSHQQHILKYQNINTIQNLTLILIQNDTHPPTLRAINNSTFGPPSVLTLPTVSTPPSLHRPPAWAKPSSASAPLASITLKYTCAAANGPSPSLFQALSVLALLPLVRGVTERESRVGLPVVSIIGE